MPRKCSVFGCKTNYKTTDKTQKVSVYRFPKNEEKRQQWIKALPNKLSNVSDHMGICARHWPHDVVKDRSAGGYIPVPVVPPSSSIFTNVPPSCIPTAPPTPRSTSKASASARAVDIDEMEEYLKQDILRVESFKDSLQIKLTILNGSLVQICDGELCFLSKQRDGPVHKLLMFFHLKQTDKDFTVTYEAYNSLKKISLPFIQKLKCWSEIDELVRFLQSELSEELNEKTKFICQCVRLMNSQKNARIYTATDLILAFSWFAMSRCLYEQLRTYITLPSVSTLRKITNVSRNTSNATLLSTIFGRLEGRKKHCILIVDEVYVKAALTYRSGIVYGYASDQPGKLATTLFCVMVKCFFGGEKFIMKLLPCHALTAEFQFQHVTQCIDLVEQCGGTVVAVVNDNNRVNQSFFRKFSPLSADTPWMVKCPSEVCSVPLFLVYDPVHILKNIRNNWITEKTQTLHFYTSSTQEKLSAKWSDLQLIHQHEETTILKLSALTPASLHPTNIEKQKVSLVLNVFSEKTSCALKTAACSTESTKETAVFIDMALQLWKVFNTKTPLQQAHQRDPDRVLVSLKSDHQLKILKEWSVLAQKMKAGSGTRTCSLTKDTASAVTWTCKSLVDLCKFLLTVESTLKHEWITLGFFQQDDLERHFAHFRMSAGCNFFISVEDASHAHSIDRTKLLLKGEAEIEYAKKLSHV